MGYSKLEEVRLDGYLVKELVDPKTGEIYEFPVRLWVPKGARDTEGFVKVFDFFWEKVIRDPDIAKSAIRLWFWICDNLAFNQTEIEISPRKVANDLNVTERQVYKWIKRLCEKGIIRKIKRGLYEIPPFTVIRGNVRVAYQMAMFPQKANKPKKRKAVFD